VLFHQLLTMTLEYSEITHIDPVFTPDLRPDFLRRLGLGVRQAECFSFDVYGNMPYA
jgi:hypothetical protein